MLILLPDTNDEWKCFKLEIYAWVNFKVRLLGFYEGFCLEHFRWGGGNLSIL